ncbi:hypothetical protein ACFL4R_01635 [Nitrospirota bacterium]
MEFSLKCQCGEKQASFHFQDNIMSPEVISRLYCPSCQRDGGPEPDSSIEDNGWAVEYDMSVAGFAAANLPSHLKTGLSPATLFDEGYATWRGVYPGDHIDSAMEREEIIKLAKVNPKEYMVRIREWANSRMERLASEGWRKANAA